MTSATKITLSDKELSLVTNAEWILTKQVIIDKVYLLFAENIPVIASLLLKEKALLPPEVKSSEPKIYKGENYLQLPYVMMDYPRCFKGENIFALRTMFWWSNFFSITLHLSGEYVKSIKENLERNRHLIDKNFYIGVNENQWEHHFEPGNFLQYQEISEAKKVKLVERNNFIKLALKYDLEQWNNMPVLLQEGYKKIAALLA
jgi:hypothetical protein